jgi:hypothetical protein
MPSTRLGRKGLLAEVLVWPAGRGDVKYRIQDENQSAQQERRHYEITIKALVGGPMYKIRRFRRIVPLGLAM